MVRVGGKLILKVCCPECGTPHEQHPDPSDLLFFYCHNDQCKYYCANIVVERKTGLVIACDAIFVFVDGKEKRVYPSLYTEEDSTPKRIWPK